MKKNIIVSLYNRIIHVLATHKQPAYFFSHGGIHLMVLLLCIVLSLLLYHKIQGLNEIQFNQMLFNIKGDSLNNYEISHLYIEKDMTDRPSNYYKFKDITVNIGFRPNKEGSHSFVKPFEAYEDSFDLVTIIDVTHKNQEKDRPDKRKYKEWPIRLKDGRLKRLMTISHPSMKVRHFHGYSTNADSTHYFLWLNAGKNLLKNWDNENPYYCFWIGLDLPPKYHLDNSSKIVIRFNHVSSLQTRNRHNGIVRPKTVGEIYPQPSYLSLDSIIYIGHEKIKEVADHGGIYVTGVDPVKKEAADKKILLLTVLIGTIFAFVLDIIIQLILKWRKLK